MKVPKYYRVKRAILALIDDLPVGSALPTEREFAEQFDTSRTTVRQAIAELVIEGRLQRTQGRGTFVSQPKLMQVRQATSFSQDLAAEGWSPGSRILAVSVVAATEEMAGPLRVEPGAQVQRVERLRTRGDEVIAHEVAHLPGVFPGLAEELAARGSLYRTLDEAYGRVVDAVEDSVETTLADPVTADLLGVDTGLPLLLVHRSAWDADGRPVEWTRSLFRGDRFRFVARHRLEDARHPAAAEPR
jgi:GntR family transcriptional regulator